ncbi:MAG: hypothetical protein ACYCOU_00295 [Sulfobacillus sp.]
METMMTFRTHAAAVRWIERQVREAGGTEAFCRQWKIRQSTVYAILNGKSKTITAKVAKLLGITLAYGRREW